jgi:hypothetical protein
MAFLDNLKRSTSTGDIRLLRGGREVVFKKVPDKFSLRFRHGTARSADSMRSLCGLLEVRVRHIESIRLARMDVFEIDDRTKLDNSMEILRSSAQVEVVSHVYNLGQDLGSEVIPTGIITIQFKPDIRATDRERILEEFGLQVIEDLDLLPDSYLVKTCSLSKKNPLKIVVELQMRKEIKIAESDIAFKVDFLYHPANPSFSRQWYLKNNGNELCSEIGADVKAENAWDITMGSQDIVICVIDDDFDLGHPKFDIPGKIIAAKDFSGNAFSTDSNLDFCSHGMACAGLALAEENGAGIIGLAPKCGFMPLKMPSFITDNSFIAMFQYAMSQNADIICCCWKARAEFFPLSAIMNALINKVATQGRRNMKGCAILFAAGNNQSPLDGAKDGISYLNGFAVHQDVIAVGACNSRNKQSFYSNFGSEIAICAPAGGGPAARSITTLDTMKGIGDNFQFNGTSGAASIASGLAALILSVKPELSASEIKKIMMETADKIDEQNGKYIDGHSLIYGHGRINAHRALQRVTQS